MSEEQSPQEAYELLVDGAKKTAVKAAKIGYPVLPADEIRLDKLERFDKLYFTSNNMPNGASRQRGAYIRAAATAGIFETPPTKNEIENMRGWEAIAIFEALELAMILSKTPDPNF